MDEGIRSRLGLPPADTGKARHDLRVFGFGLAVILLALAALAWRKGRPAAPYELGLACVSAGLAALRPEALSPVYKPWMKAAGFIGKVNTYLIMGLVYYLLITPYALVIRLLGLDLLDEKMRDRESYWRAKGPPPEPQSYQNQF